jgi:hypothetical protein
VEAEKKNQKNENLCRPNGALLPMLQKNCEVHQEICVIFAMDGYPELFHIC